MKNIVIFASGSGSNAEKIIDYFNNSHLAIVTNIMTNNASGKVVDVAKKNNISTLIFNKDELENGSILLKLTEIQPDLIILAGFLLKFPVPIITYFKNKIINIHPALLPKYGGKGMYGLNVHKKVLENKEIESGITIHHVSEYYDEGHFIFQKSISISDCTTAEEIAVKILHLEHLHFSIEIEKLLNNNL